MVKQCEWCGDQFEGRKDRRYCSGEHYKDCEWCGTSFKIRDVTNPAKGCSMKCSMDVAKQNRLSYRTCELCNKDFQTINRRARFCDDDHFSTCVVCSGEFKINNPHKPSSTCSKQCAWKSIDDIDELLELRKHITKERYGHENPSQVPEFKEKKRLSAQDRYGVDNPSQALEVRQKRTATFIKNYGVDHPLKTKKVMDKLKSTNLERYGAENVFATEDFKENHKKLMLERYGVENILQLPEHQIKAAMSTGRRISKTNKSMHQRLLDELGVEFQFEVEFGDNYYADLGYGDLLFELNPTVSHNDTISYIHLTGRCNVVDCDKLSHMPRPQDYHQQRALAAEADGKTLLQMFEWHDPDQFLQIVRRELFAAVVNSEQGFQHIIEEWRQQHNVMTGIPPALDYTIVESHQQDIRPVAADDAEQFHHAYHIDDFHTVATGDSTVGNVTMLDTRNIVHIGAYFGDALIHVQSYAALDDADHWQLVQYATHHDYFTPAAVILCHDYFTTEYNPVSAIYFADLATDSIDVLFAADWNIEAIRPPESVEADLHGAIVHVFDVGTTILTWERPENRLQNNDSSETAIDVVPLTV